MKKILILCLLFPYIIFAQTPISGIINSYSPVVHVGINYAKLSNHSVFSVNDTVMLIQMKGATIDTTNTSSFGSISNYNGAGNYEFFIIQCKNVDTVFFSSNVTKTFNNNGAVQLVKVKSYNDAIVTDTLRPQAWNGSSGGVIVLWVHDTLTLNAPIVASGRGFRGGTRSFNPNGACGSGYSAYHYPLMAGTGAEKGEGIADTIINKSAGRGPQANGGGGGNKHNTGGGGGGNFSTGGIGGNTMTSCSPATVGGIGGNGLSYGTKIFMGGGGGCSDNNNAVGTVGTGGGGIIIVSANTLVGNNKNIVSNGLDQGYIYNGIGDGAGGGGAGGSILLHVNTYSTLLTINANGGHGGDQFTTYPAAFGPGGGGGVGAIWIKGAALPSNVSYTTTPGTSGTIIGPTTSSFYGSKYGATDGAAANGFLSNLSLTLPPPPTSPILNFTDNNTGCNSKIFTATGTWGSGSTITWYFGNGSSATGNPVTYKYPVAGTYTVTAVLSNGTSCVTSFSRSVTVPPNPSNSFLISDSIINCKVVRLTATNAGTSTINSYYWDFGDFTTGTGNPVIHTYPSKGTYNVKFVTTTDLGCVDTFYHTVINNYKLDFKIADTLINCNTKRLIATNKKSDLITSYVWYFGDGKSGNGNPIDHQYPNNGTYNVQLITTSNVGCTDTFNYSLVLNYNMDFDIIDSAINCSTTKLDVVNKKSDVVSFYNWQFGDGKSGMGSPVIHKYNTYGIYNVRVIITNVSGCVDTFDKQISLKNIPAIIFAGNDTTICHYGAAQLSASGGVQYEWFPKLWLNNPYIKNPIARPEKQTTYIVNGTDENGCTGTDSLTIFYHSAPNIKITSDDREITCDNNSIQLFASGGVRYEWSPAEYVDDSLSASPIVTPPKYHKFQVIGYDQIGCFNYAVFTVDPKKEVKVIVPSVFTPNNDGLNDKIYPIIVCNYIFESFSVYNRWGEVVFKTNTYKHGWDGKYNGQLQPLGEYYYIVMGFTEKYERIMLKGSFTLIQ